MNTSPAQIIENTGHPPPQFREDWPRISDSLRAICHEHIYKIASIDPFPHTRILNRCRAVIHLVGMVISKPSYSKHHAYMVLGEPDIADAIEMTFGRSVEGLKNILKKMPVAMLSRESYQQLASLLFDHRAMKVLQHSETITAELISILDDLPEELRLSPIIKHIIIPGEAKIINMASSPDDGPSGSRSRSRFASRLVDCTSRKTFWNAIQDEIFERFVQLPKAPKIDDPRVTNIQTVGEINKASQQFHNCMKNLVDMVADGELGFYSYEESGKRAIISIKPVIGLSGMDGFTAEIDEIKGVKNAKIPEAMVKKIEAIFAKNGIGPHKPRLDTSYGAMGRQFRDLKRFTHPADIERATAKLEEAIYAAT